jgi:hypothetical protein
MSNFPEMEYRPIAQDEQIELAPDEKSLHFLQKVYRDPRQPIERRMRAATRALDFEFPKLSAVSMGFLNGDDFAARLDRAIQYAERRLKIIEARPLPENEE